MDEYSYLIDINLNPLIVYYISQQKSLVNSFIEYKTLSGAVGINSIPCENFKKLFNRYLNEYDKRDFLDLNDDIRWCILSDVISNKAIEKSYVDIYEAFGRRFIDWNNFEKWAEWSHLRLASKNVKFSDLPVDIYRKLLEVTDLKTQLCLREVCRVFKTLIDQQRPNTENMQIVFDESFINFNFKLLPLDFEDYLQKVAIIKSELGWTIRNPNLQLKSFETHYDTDSMYVKSKNRFETLLKSLNHKIYVENVSIQCKNQSEVTGILPYLKPGALKSLKIKKDRERQISIDEIVKMDQWKQAEHVKIERIIESSMDNFFHFTTFDIRIPSISVDDVVKLIQVVSTSRKFKSCTIKIEENLDTETIKKTLNLQRTDSPDAYPIPNLDLVIEFMLNATAFTIRKTES